MWVLKYFFLLTAGVANILAAAHSNAGTDFVIPAFYATYGEEDDYNGTSKLFISGLESSASINLTLTGREDVSTMTFSVGEGCTIPVPLTCRLSAKRVGTQTSVFHVEADQPIAVRMHQEHLTPNMATAYLSLPTSALGTDYYVVDPGNSASQTELMITAVEGAAQIRVAPSSLVEYGGTSYDDGGVLWVSLQMFETLILRSDGDLTGTRVTSDTPISVIVSDFCSPDMPSDTICRQPIQLIPVDRWGQRFVVTSFISSEHSVYQIFAYANETTITLLGGGSEVTTVLFGGESSVENARSGNTYIVEADRPICVIQYEGNGQGLMVIPAENHRVTGCTSVPVIANLDRNAEAHVLITTACANSNGFHLDLEPLPPSSSVLRSSDDSDCIVRAPITGGNHLINHESFDVQYSVIVHVTDDEMSYAYSSSISLDDDNDTATSRVMEQGATRVQAFDIRPKARNGVLLKWKPPTSWPGEPRGYRIQMKAARDPAFCQCRNIIIYNPRRTACWIPNLSVGERYIVGVRPFGSLGSGEITMQVVRRSNNDIITS